MPMKQHYLIRIENDQSELLPVFVINLIKFVHMKKREKIVSFRKKPVLYVLFCIILFTSYVNAKSEVFPTSATTIGQQTNPVRGTVADENGEPVIGASVAIKGTTKGTVTDIDGHFLLEVNQGETLVISYIGYHTREIMYTGQSAVTVNLKEDTQNLEEIVVVGYGVQKRESLTGALQTLKNEKLTNITTPAVQNMLNGKVPGVYVAPGSGRPGSSGSIVIRGKTSINGETRPLWVIDGVISGTSPNNSLNPSDIETVTILKDAASTAIYGSQGANGVIVVTTRKGSSDKLTISASAKLGVNKLSNGNMEVMNGEELYDLYKSFSNQEMISFPRWNESLRNSNYDWWKIATQSGIVQEYNISASGGTDKIKSYFSLGFYDEAGAVKGYDYNKYSFRVRTEMKPTTWLTIKPLVAASMTDIGDKEYSVTSMYSKLPWDSPYLADGTPTPHYSQTWVNSNTTNYLYDLQWNRNESARHTFSGNFDFDIRITDWLSFSSVNNYSYNNYEYKALTDPRSNSGSGVDGRLEERVEKTVRRYTNQILRFDESFGKHAVNGLVAYEFNDYTFKYLQAIGTGFVPGFEALNVTAKPEKTAGYIQEKAKQSLIFNAHYSYDHKYLAQVSLRRDGASNFGDNRKYGNFFSVSGGWNIEREEFMNYDWLNQLKLRASYGSTGNDPTAYYPQYDLYAVNSKYNEDSGALIYQIGNKELTWEKTYTLGIGLDIAVLDRVRATLDYYNKYTSNVLFEVPVSGLTGVTKVWRNIGEMSNNGFELSLGGDIIKSKDLNWGVDFNIGLNKNKIEKLYGDEEDLEIITTSYGGIAGSINRILKKGFDADTYHGREWAGVNPETGASQWYMTDENKNRVITENYASADEVVLGKYSPDFYGGFSTNLTWKKLDFNAVFGYSVGGKIYNYARQEYDSDGAYTDRNQMKLHEGWSRWEKPGDIATHPLPSYNNTTNSNKVSSRYIEDGDYLTLRSLTLGYNLNLPKWQVSNLRLFISAENVFTLTDYSGVNPEVSVKSDDSSIVNVVGPAAYPVTRKFIFGINITL
jgi:TonB-linked SusC/RagA family outer membrane protein